jgi:5'-nucleotidase / UDP-sugar diphosphatase
MRRFIAISLFLIAAFIGMALYAQPRAAFAEELRLGIIHTNDTHGHMMPFRVNGEDGWGGVAKRRVAIQRARADTSYYWLTLDAGDVFQGTPLSNLLTGFLDLECMNQMGYDAMCLGNHEFDFGYDLIRGRMQDANFSMLSANIIDRERGMAVAKPYIILRRGDYRIGVIGITSETLPGETNPRIKESVVAYPAIPVVKSLAGYLRAAGCDIVIALCHEGYDRDLKLAEAVPELDVIVGGHSHTFLTEPTRVGNVIVTQDGQWGQNLGELKLTFERPDGSGERFALENEANKYEPMKPGMSEDDGLMAFIGDYNQRFEAEMGKPVCTAAVNFPVEDIRVKENALADLIADAMRAQLGADVVLFNGGNFRAGLEAGTVTFGDLYGVLPYDNFLMKVPVTGEKLREILEFAGKQYGDGGFPQVSGMRVKYVDMALVEATVGGAPIDPKKEYTLLVTDFLAIGGDGFPLSEDPYGRSFTGMEQRATFAQWAAQQRTITMKTDGRVVFEWVNMADPGIKD